MLSDDTPALMTATNDRLAALREIEFSQALAHYIASYLAENRRGLQGRMEGRVLKRLRASTPMAAATPNT